MQPNVFVIILILVTVFILFLLVAPLIAKLGGFELPSFINVSLEAQKKPELKAEFEFGTEWETVLNSDLTLDGQPQTATHAACAVGKLTYDDFVQHGEELHGIDIPLTNLRLLNWAGLKFDWNAKQNRPYVIKDLDESQKQKLYGAGCTIECAPVLDEKCVTKYFDRLKIGGQSFCGTFTKFVSGKLQTLKFGNNKCQAAGDQTWGLDEQTNPLLDDKCGETICKEGGNRIVNIKADTSLNAYDIEDGELKEEQFPPADTPLQPNYVFLLYWNVNEEAYTYSFTKMPRNGVDQPLTIPELKSQIVRHLNNYKRSVPGAYSIPELGVVSALGYVLKEGQNAADFLDGLKIEIGGETSVEQCETLGDCLPAASGSVVPYRKVQFTTMQTDWDGGVDLHEDFVYEIDVDLNGNFKSSEFLGESKEFFKRAKIFTNMQNDETLDRKSLYFILVRSWELKEREEKDRNAKDIGLYCVNLKTKAVRQAKNNCESGEVVRNYINTYRGFLDRSIIIYKQPLFGFDECGNGFGSQDACGTKQQILDLGQTYERGRVLLRFTPAAAGKLTIEHSLDEIKWAKIKEEDVSPRKTSDGDAISSFEFLNVGEPFRYIRLQSDAELYSSAKLVDDYDLGFDYCGNGLPAGDNCGGSEQILDLQQRYKNREVQIVWEADPGIIEVEYSADGNVWKSSVSASTPTGGLHSIKTTMPDEFRFVKVHGIDNLDIIYSEAVIR